MGELHVSADPAQQLSAIGLGSCIALVLIDRLAVVAGLAHIVLPESKGNIETPAKFADTAVPEMLLQMQRAGAEKPRLEAALVGGARMFELGSGLDIGRRNEEAVKDMLGRERIRIRAMATGGKRGRTVRITVGDGLVTVQEAGGVPQQLLGRMRT